MAREKLDVISIIFNNRSYAILNVELQRVGAVGASDKARAQLDLKTPPLDFVRLGESMGVPSRRATTTEEFLAAFEHALRTPGPAPHRGHRAADPDRTEAARIAARAAVAGQPAAGSSAGDQTRHCALITAFSAVPAACVKPARGIA